MRWEATRRIGFSCRSTTLAPSETKLDPAPKPIVSSPPGEASLAMRPGSPVVSAGVGQPEASSLHRHHGVWDDAHRFDPERFAPERERGFKSCQFLPFGAGPRICSGMAFAMVEATVILATLIRDVRFELASRDFVPTPISRVVLVPKEGLPLRVVFRPGGASRDKGQNKAS